MTTLSKLEPERFNGLQVIFAGFLQGFGAVFTLPFFILGGAIYGIVKGIRVYWTNVRHRSAYRGEWDVSDIRIACEQDRKL